MTDHVMGGADGAQRQALALDAVYEIDALSNVILREFKASSEDLAIRGIVMRVRELSSILMSVMSDARETVGDVHLRLYGREAEDA